MLSVLRARVGDPFLRLALGSGGGGKVKRVVFVLPLVLPLSFAFGRCFALGFCLALGFSFA